MADGQSVTYPKIEVEPHSSLYEDPAAFDSKSADAA